MENKKVVNDFKKLSLDDLVQISGETDAWFNEHYEKDEEGYYASRLA